MRRVSSPSAVLILVLSVLAAATVTAGPAHTADPARARACAWTVEPSADRENILFPDTATRYLGAVLPVPPGGAIEIKGRFPHARYMSLQEYSATLQTTSNLRDDVIDPDPGSVNPFRVGADRDAAHRDYTVRVVGGRAPAGGGAPNTLYQTSADGTRTGVGFAYRIYVPDRGTGAFGGVPAPALTMILASGQRIPVPSCPDVVPDVGLTQALAGLGLSDYLLPPLGLLAPARPRWHKYVNAPTSYATGVTDTQYTTDALTPAVTKLTQLLPSGLGENADNKYVYAYLSQEYGKVIRLRARLPTTPRTYEGDKTVPRPRQMRYWSMCTGNRATQTYGCVLDQGVPVDRRGYFTIAISTAANRPSDATAACGVAWLPWGPDPKGIAFVRNMLPRADFTHAVQSAVPGTEAATMGAYYPTGRYYATADDFERDVGCHPGVRRR